MINEEILELAGIATADERRKTERRPLTIEIQFIGGGARGTATTRDIGIGGLYIVTDADLPVNLPISMRIVIGEQSLFLNGVVTYRDEGFGVGVRFQNLSGEAKNILRAGLPFD